MNVYKAAETEDFSDCVERASIVCVCINSYYYKAIYYSALAISD